MVTTETPVSPDACIAFDLTLLGAVSGDAYESLGADLPVEYANYPQLASCAHAATRGGIDHVVLSADFHARSDTPHATDAARVAARLLSQEAGHVAVEIPCEPARAGEAIDLLGSSLDAASTYVTVTGETSADDLERTAAMAHDVGCLFGVALRASEGSDGMLAAIARCADRVRVLGGQRDEVAAIRSRLAELAGSRGVRVFGEIGIVISGSPMAAHERAILVEAMSGSPLFEGKTSVVGTVYDVADAVEQWLGSGAADGIIMLPASLPTDLASVIRGVIPLLKARAEDVAA